MKVGRNPAVWWGLELINLKITIMKKYTTGSSLIKKQYKAAKDQLLSNGFELSEYGEIVNNISAYAVYKNAKLDQEVELSYYWVKRAGGYTAGSVFNVEFV